MNVKEFSDGFDILANSHSAILFGNAGTPFEFDEYEKSLYLTKAQEEVVLSLYSGEVPFEASEEVREYLGNLVKTFTREPSENGNYKKISGKSYVFDVPDDLWFIVYESVTLSDGSCYDGKSIKVVPTTHDEYSRVVENPFRKPNKRKALRLNGNNGKIEIVTSTDISNYYCRYLSKPTPIVLADFDEGLSIDEVSVRTECKLHEALHKRILDLAVAKAIASRATKEKK